MDSKAFIELLSNLHTKEINKLVEKEKQYSNDANRFHNFERISNLHKIKRTTVALLLMSKQLIALDDWLKSYENRNDGVSPEEFYNYVEEYILDLRNYLALIYAMLYEEIQIDT